MSSISHQFQQRIEQCQGLVRSVAAKIHRGLPGHVDLDDLIGYGQTGLLEAAQEFDPSRGVKFSTFAYYRIRGAIYDGLAKMSWSKRSRRDLKYGQMSNDVLRLQNEDAGESASRASLGNHAQWFHDITSTLAVVFLAAQEGSDESRDHEFIDSQQTAPPTLAADDEIHSRLYAAIEQLPFESALLVRTVYFEGMTLQEVADLLGISKSWASRLHAKALRRLARSLQPALEDS